jgi:hypothetical protein
MALTVAALYIDPHGPYPRMAGVDCWDAARDARNYAGPYPVVAHPPCGAWANLKHLSRGDGRDLAFAAVAQVRRYGGVLEHPRGSRLWRALRMPLPGELPDEHGGSTFAVTQVAWGHPARKHTWLYCVGIDRALVASGIRSGGIPTHWVSGGRAAVRGPVPQGIKVCSAPQRRRTPQAFADWLVYLARHVAANDNARTA